MTTIAERDMSSDIGTFRIEEVMIRSCGRWINTSALEDPVTTDTRRFCSYLSHDDMPPREVSPKSARDAS